MMKKTFASYGKLFKFITALAAFGFLIIAGLLTFSKLLPFPAHAEPDPPQEEMYGVFPLVRKNQAFEWREDKWQLKSEFLDMLDKDYVAGVTYYDGWAAIEWTPGEYNWGFTNQIVAAVKERGKIVNIGIACGQFSPEWIYDQGVIKKEYISRNYKTGQPESVIAPLPWDEKYLELYFDLVNKFGEKLKASPNFYSPVKRIVIGGPTNTLGFEMVISGSPQDQEYYIQAGYPEKFVAAWEQAVDRFVISIPENIELNLVWHRGLQGHWTNQYSKEVVDYVVEQGLISRVDLMSLGLKGKNWWNFSDTPHPNGDPTKEKEMLLMLAEEQKRGFKLGLQFFSRDDTSQESRAESLGTYELAVKNAVDANSVWVEPWVEDLLEETTGSVTFEKREELLKWLNNQLKLSSLPGDANGDRRVDSEDFALLVEDYLGKPVHNTDFNGDGRVDSEDFAILQSNYLKEGER